MQKMPRELKIPMAPHVSAQQPVYNPGQASLLLPPYRSLTFAGSPAWSLSGCWPCQLGMHNNCDRGRDSCPCMLERRFPFSPTLQPFIFPLWHWEVVLGGPPL